MRNELSTENTLALMVDMQLKLMPAMAHREAVAARSVFLTRSLNELQVPVAVSQQYTRGLGATVEALDTLIDQNMIFDKITYSCWKDEAIQTFIKAQKKENILLFGVESHICVQQTALDLLSEGYQVYLICDCTDSRSPFDRDIAFRRMEAAGVILTTSESVVYELLGRAGTPVFKKISGIVKETPLFDKGELNER